jgi:hypothetical protein
MYLLKKGGGAGGKRAKREVMADYSGTEEWVVRTPIRLRMEKIIGEEYLEKRGEGHEENSDRVAG